MRKIPSSTLTQAVTGYNLSGATFGEVLGERPTLLVFLRHFGCTFCREMVQDLKEMVEGRADAPELLFFYMGAPDEGEAFFSHYWPQARAVADAERVFYHAFGLNRGSWKQMFGLEVLACGIRAASKGHGLGRPVGDPLQMPGLFLVKGSELLWQHDFKHAGDHPDFLRLPSLLPSLPPSFGSSLEPVMASPQPI